MIDDSLGYTLKASGCFLPEDHPLYLEHRRSMRNISICSLVKDIESYKLCCGVEASELTSQLFHHVIPLSNDPLKDEQDHLFPDKGYWRSKDCALMCDGGEDTTCQACMDYVATVGNTTKAKERQRSKPAHVKATVSKNDPARLKLTLQKQRLRCADLERELNEMRAEIMNSSLEVDHELSNDFTSILENSDEKITPFMNRFWQQQRKLLTNSRTGVRYHPMIRQFCLSVAAKSASCYEEL